MQLRSGAEILRFALSPWKVALVHRHPLPELIAERWEGPPITDRIVLGLRKPGTLIHGTDRIVQRDRHLSLLAFAVQGEEGSPPWWAPSPP